MASKSASSSSKPPVRPDDSPSMEEILNSIRGVIGEDSSADTPEVEELKMDDDIVELTEEWVDDSIPVPPPPPRRASPEPEEPKAEPLPPPASPPAAPKPAIVEKSKTARPELLDELLEDEEQPRESPQRRSETPLPAEGKRPRAERPDSVGDARQEAATPRGSDKFSRGTDMKDEASRDGRDRDDERAALLSDNAAALSATALKELLNSIPKPRHDSPALRADTTLEELVITAIRPYLAEWLNRNLPDIVKQLVYKEIRKLIPEED